MKYRLGTRKSLLAQTQSTWILQALEKQGLYCELVIIESEGDRSQKLPLYEIDPLVPGLFTKQLEDALLQNEIDLAVHSLKDLPTTQPPGLMVGAVPTRAIANDCLLIHEEVFRPDESLYLPQEAVVGTSSLRREAFLLSQRPDLKITPIRGNIPTRVKFVEERSVDAILLASAGLERTQLKTRGIRRWDLPLSLCVPAPGQGALAVEVRNPCDPDLLLALRKIHDETTATETRVERAILKGLFGGCTLPLGVKCRVEPSGNILCQAFVGVSKDRLENKHAWKGFHHFDISDASEQTLVTKAIEHLKGYLNA